MQLGGIMDMAKTRAIAESFKDGKIDQKDAQQLFEAANPNHTLKEGDDQEALAKNVAHRISLASGGKVSDADALAVSKAIVRELYETVVHSSGNGKFDTVKSPFKPSTFDFPVTKVIDKKTQQETDEKLVKYTVLGRDEPFRVQDLQDSPATRKTFLERCVQLDGDLKTKWDRSGCAIVSTLGGYILADPKAFQQLGKALQTGPVTAMPGFAKLREHDKGLQGALKRIADGKFSPMDVIKVSEALAKLNGVTGPDYAKGTDKGLSLQGAADFVAGLTAAGAPPPDGLTLGGVGGMHQVSKYEGEYFDSSTSGHVSNGHKANYATVSPNLDYLKAGIDDIELVFSGGGTKAEFRTKAGAPEPMVLVGNKFEPAPPPK